MEGNPEVNDVFWYRYGSNRNAYIIVTAILNTQHFAPKGFFFFFVLFCFVFPAERYFAVYERLNGLLRFRLSKNRQVGGNIHLATLQEN